MTTLDIRGTVVGETSIAIKAPCLVATTGGNITLSGVQTIDGVVVGNNAERVLVKDQTSQTQNGIYIAGTGTWVYAADFTSNNNIALGSLVLVASGSVNQGILFEQITTDNPIIIGTSNIVFSALANNTSQAATSTTSITVGMGARTLTIQAGKAFSAGQYVVIYETSAPSTVSMLATVTSYTGASLVVSVVATTGSGTHSDWSVVLNNSQAGAGIAPPVGSGNVTGPGSSTTGHIATFADGTGKVLSDGGAPGIPNASSINASMLLQSAVGFGVNMFNGTLVFSNNGTALTITVKTLAGNVPSLADPVWFVFRDSTVGNGVYVPIEVTSALSTTIPSGSTLNSSSGVPFGIWAVAVNDTGTVSLAVINVLSGTNIFPLAGWGIANVTAYDGGANSAQVFYGTTGHASVPYSVLGYFSYEAGIAILGTAGTWNANPARSELLRPGVPLPGAEVQTAESYSGAVTSGATAFVTDDTIPPNTRGAQLFQRSIVPTSSKNILRITGMLNLANGNASPANTPFALFQDATVNALASWLGNSAGPSEPFQAMIEWSMLAATLSSTTFKINVGDGVGSTITLNGSGAARKFGGSMASYLRVKEIQA